MMPGLGAEVVVRRFDSGGSLGGGSGSAGGRLVCAWAAMVQGVRRRLERWESLWCGARFFRFLVFIVVCWERLRTESRSRCRDLRGAGSCLAGGPPGSAVPVSILLLLLEVLGDLAVSMWGEGGVCVVGVVVVGGCWAGWIGGLSRGYWLKARGE